MRPIPARQYHGVHVASVAEASVEILLFELAGQRYGVPLRSVREVVRAVAITPLPTAPAIIEGIINVRGVIAPVYDLRRRFGLPPKPIEPADHLVIALSQARLVALRVDRADWMAEVPESDIEDATTLVSRADHVDGVAKLPDGLVLIHDIDTFLSQAEAAALDAALRTGGADGQMGGWAETEELR